MPENLLRSGQVADALGVSRHNVRRLYESGLVQGKMRNGKLCIPMAELDRLQAEGVPPLPMREGTEEEQSDPSGDGGTPEHENRPRPAIASKPRGWIAPPSSRFAEKAEKVRETELAIDETRLQRTLAMERDVSDREQRQRDRKAAQQTWLDWALAQTILRDFEDDHVAVFAGQRAVKGVLDSVDDDNPVAIAAQLHRALRQVLRPFVKRGHQDGAVNGAIEESDLRWAPADWKQKARSAARAELSNLDDQAEEFEMREIAGIVVRRIAAEYRHPENVEEALQWIQIAGATRDENYQAREAARAALEEVPSNAGKAAIERAKEKAIAPIVAAVEQRRRQEAKRAKQEHQQQIENLLATMQESQQATIDAVLGRSQRGHASNGTNGHAHRGSQAEAERKAGAALSKVPDYCAQFFDYHSSRALSADARQLQENLQPRLVNMIRDGKLSDDRAIRGWVQRQIRDS